MYSLAVLGEDEEPLGNANGSSSNYTILPRYFAGVGITTHDNASISNAVVNSDVVMTYFVWEATSDSSVWQTVSEDLIGFRYKMDSISCTTNGFVGVNVTFWVKVVTLPSASKISGVDLTVFEGMKMVFGLKDLINQTISYSRYL